ncbi:MAG: hypothetical protein D4R67_05750 [Bacteroidetes bacterium]|nr:MAG: hypothetical protein D4R67_05750 [Bacteroidota bacterium]
MKTAIAIKEASTQSRLDKHFGKSAFFLILDDITKQTEVFENPSKAVCECKGNMIINVLIQKGVKRVIAGDFGTHVQQLLNKHHIQMIIHPDEKVSLSDIILLLIQKTD